MSKRARDAKTARFVKHVRPAWPALDEDIQTVVAERVFTGNMFLTLSPVSADRYPPSRVVCRTMRVGFERYIAAHVNQTWNRAFKA